ncbi:MAG: hypothetical protein JST64_16055 [Actinobacteria bacterium]|nr:hypothetical protein [Actinomycetota bacterium]
MITTNSPIRGRHVAVRLAAIGLGAAVVALFASGCSGDEGATGTTAERTTTTDAHYGTHSAMAPATATVADIASLGPGPAVGSTASGFVGLDVCGRFLPLSTTVPADVAAGTGISFPSEGRFSVTPPTPQAAGHGATVGSLARALGVEVGSRTVTFGAGAAPKQIEVAGTTVEVAGRTFGPDVRCGDTAAEVQLWVYSAKAVETGEGLVKVIEDPQDVPIAQDGMAFVIAVTPESSLPTLPPSALVR